MLELKGRKALITGGTAGIGAATARLFAELGVDLIISGRNESRLSAFARELIEIHDVTVRTVAADFSDPAAVEIVARSVTQNDGALDVLINNAGGVETPGTVLTEQVWRREFEINFHAKRRVTEELLPLLIQSGRGRVITLSTLMEPTHVSAAQAAVTASIMWSKGMARTYAPQGVTFNCVAPGRIISAQMERVLPAGPKRDEYAQSMIPMKRLGEAHEAAQLIAFLASDASSYITGQNIALDGGLQRAL
jgi:3-oxoacyl-[acyl-carrier protein] reductase